MDRATVRLSFISVLMAVILVAVLGMAIAFELGTPADTALADAHTHDGYTAWTATDSLPTEGNYYLTDNVTVSGQTIVQDGNVVNLCLNGYSVTNTVSRIYLVNNGGTLHVYDDVGSGSMRGEKLNTNYDNSIGTVVRVAAGGYFELHGGTLYGSSTPGKGYFTVLTNGEFVMSGGMITEENDQFGVQAEGANSVFRMTGGTITNCKGGGVHVYGGTAYISGGTISNNGEARAFGGVLLLSDYATSKLFLSGNPTIVNNTNNQGVDCNVNLYGTKTITIDGALTNTTPIGVTRAIGTFTSGWSTYMGDADPADYFVSDNEDYRINLYDGEAEVIEIAPFEGLGTEARPYLIQSADDWNTLADHINSRGTKYNGKYYKLTADIHITTPLGIRPGNSDKDNLPFIGVFDGDGHTIDCDIHTNSFAAPFAVVHNATIKNLKVTGVVTSSANHASGLVSASIAANLTDASTLVIQDVVVSADVSCNSHVAGIVGHAHRATITMNNVVFDGSISASSVQGGFIGWGGLTVDIIFNATFTDCVYAGTYRSGTAFYPVAFASGQGNVTLTNDFYSLVSWSGGSPITPGGSGQVKLYVATVEKDGDVAYYSTFADASANCADGGTIKLHTDISISTRWDVPTGTINLDLNGHSLTRTNASDTTGSVIQVGSGATLNLHDSGKETRYYVVDEPSINGAGLGRVVDKSEYDAAAENARGTFVGGYITGGCITGAQDNNHLIGGGVNVAGGAFTMYGGTIIGNWVCINGAAVKVKGTGASFVMNGGALLANYNQCYGGAISVGNNANLLGTLTINGGTIARNWSGRNGGAIHFDNYAHTFVITGGTITGNYTNGNFESLGRSGAGVMMDGAILILSGDPIIKDNMQGAGFANNIYIRTNSKCLDLGGGLSADAYVGVYTKEIGASVDVKIATNASRDDVKRLHFDIPSEGCLVYCDGEKDWLFLDGEWVEMAGTHHTHEAGTVWACANPIACVSAGEETAYYCTFDAAASAWTASGDAMLKLLADVTTSTTITIQGAGTKTMDLNGHGIRKTGNTRMFYVSGATFILDDSNTTVIHKYTIPSAVQGAGLAVVNDAATGEDVKTFVGGYITGANSADDRGAVVSIEDGGIFTLNGGTLIGNTTSAGHGGGAVALLAYAGNRFVMNGGAIIGNTTTNGWGGGVYLHEGASFTMNGGVIKENYASKGGNGAGGGITVEGGSSYIVLNGGAIINNVAQNHGGNINLAAAHTQISGNIVISGGKLTSGANDNVYVNGNRVFEMTGALTEGFSLYLTRSAGAVTSGWSTYMDSEADPADYFVSDNASYVVGINAAGEALCGEPRTVTYDANGYGTAPGAAIVASGALVKQPEAPTDDIKMVVGWYKESACVNEWDFAADTVSANITLYAKWEEKPHTWAYTASGNVIYANCTYDGCEVGTQALSLRAESKEYDGMPVAATITASSGWIVANGLDMPEITYSGNTDVGVYTASITVGDVSVSVEFRIFAVPQEKQWRLTGTVKDGTTPVVGAELTLMQGNNAIAVETTDAQGNYYFVVDEGVYNLVVAYADTTATAFVALYADTEKDISITGDKTESKLNVVTEEDLGIAVGGLEKEAQDIRAAHPEALSVTVQMTIEPKTEETAANATPIVENVKNKQFAFLDITVEQMINEVRAVLDNTTNVIEIAIPYAKINRRGLTVYSYHDNTVRTFVESNSRENGTYRVDKENGYVYVYTNSFSTYAIGYTPYYRMATALSLGGYTGNVTVTLDSQEEDLSYTLEDVEIDNVCFADVAMGTYTMTVTWRDGAVNTLKMTISVGPDGIKYSAAPAEEESVSVAAAAEATPEEEPSYWRDGYEPPAPEDTAVPTSRKNEEQEAFDDPKRRGEQD